MSTDTAALLASIDAAIERRRPEFEDSGTDAYRLFHGWTEGCPRLEIDKWSSALTIDARESTAGLAEVAARHLEKSLSPTTIVIRVRAKNASSSKDPQIFRGPPESSVVVKEGPLSFQVEPHRARNPGLHLDARPARRWLRDNSKDRRILNLFAFTGSLGMAAQVGGARSVVHVDSQRSALQRLRNNYELNQLRIDDRDLVRLNIYQHLRKAAAKRQVYQGIILDCPPYYAHHDRTPGERGVFAVAKHASEMLAPGGWLLCFFHHLQEERGQLESKVMDTCAGGLSVLWRGESGSDFPEDDPMRKSRMTAFVRK